MKLIFLFSVFFSSLSFAQSLSQISQCLTGLDRDEYVDEGPYKSILIRGASNEKASMLILSEKGALQVQSGFEVTDEEEKVFSSTFIVPGHKLKVTQGYRIVMGNELEPLWPVPESKEKLSKSRPVTAIEAIRLASPTLLQQAQDKMSKIKQQKSEMEAYLKLPMQMAQMKAFTKDVAQKSFEERVAKREQVFQKDLENLKACQEILKKNKDQQADFLKAVEIETSRISELQSFLNSISGKSTATPAKTGQATDSAK